MDRYDVLVIGAGLAGLQSARLLGRGGFRVLLVDRKSSPDQSIQTTGIFVRRTLEDFDLPADCLGAAIRTVRLYSPRRRSLLLESPNDEFRIGRIPMLYRHYLAECRSAGVEWMPETHFIGAHRMRGGSLVQLKTPSGAVGVFARFLVGADGTHSRVARTLGLDLNRKWIVGVEQVVAVRTSHVKPALHCFLDPVLAPGYIAWFASDGMEAHLGVGGDPRRFRPAEALRRFCASVPDLIGGCDPQPIEQRGGSIPVGGILHRIGNDQGLLVGDAAGAVSPLTAGGLDACMRLSQFAAQVAGAYLVSNDPDVLLTYQGGRFRSRRLSRRWIRAALSGTRNAAMLEAACAALRIGPLKDLATRIFFGRGSFPDVQLKAVYRWRMEISKP
ncbi:MAG: NAD(P)/FAD-dependent oxidoreductase [Acidobacteria bacterium]|nr:NAD(P)/FAD-dependent oxidoreductase [Acidobacteriota bacterium]